MWRVLVENAYDCGYKDAGWCELARFDNREDAECFLEDEKWENRQDVSFMGDVGYMNFYKIEEV